MALSAREMFLIIRAQNQASGALRRVARDVGGLGNVRNMQLGRQRLMLAGDQLRVQRQLATNEIERISTGTRALGLEKARTAQSLATQRAEVATMTATQQSLRQQEATLRNQVQRARLGRAVSMVRDPAVRADLQKLYTAAAIAAQRLQIEEDRVGRKVSIANQALAAQQTNLRQLTAREAEAAQRADYLVQRQAHLSEAIGLNRARVAELAREIKNVRWDRVAVGGRVIQHLGVISQYAGLAIGGAFGTAAHYAASFNTQIGLAATQVGNTTQQVVRDSAQMQRSVLQLLASGRTTASMQDLSSALYDIFSSLTFRGTQRQQVTQGTQILNVFSKAAIGGLTNIVDVAHAGITALNDFGTSGGNQAKQITTFMNRMFAAVRFGRMTFAEFVQTMAKTAPAAKQANQSFDQMAGAMAFLTRRIPNVQMAATSYARLLEVFRRPEFVAGLRSFGVHITDAHNRLIPLEQIINRLITRFPKLARGEQSPAEFFKMITAAGGSPTGLVGTIQARRAAGFLFTQFKDYRQLLHATVNDQNEFSKSFRSLADTSAVKWQLFVNQIKAFAIEIGEQAIPAITQLARPLMNAVRWFNRLDQGTKRQIGRIGVYGAAILLAAGALSFMLGIVVRLYAMLGRGVGFWNSTLLLVGLVATAVGVLTGGWRSLNDVVYGFLSFGTGSLTGWVTMLGIAAISAYKLAKALIAVRAASIGAGEAGLIGLIGGARNLGAGVGLFREARATEGTMAALLATATLIPTPLKAAAFAIGLAIPAAILWKQHLDGVRRVAEETRMELESTRRIAAEPLQFARQFAGVGGTARTVAEARNSIALIREDIRTARQQGASRAYVRSLTLQLADAEDRLGAARYRSNRAFIAFSAALASAGRNSRAIRDTLTRLHDLQRLLNMERAARASGNEPESAARQRIDLEKVLGINDPEQLQRAINIARQRLNILRGYTRQTVQTLQREFGAQIRSLARTGGIRGITPRVIRDMFQVALGRGRTLTIPEIRAFVKAELDPRSRRQMPHDVQRAIQEGLKRARPVPAVVGRTVGVFERLFGTDAQAKTRSARIALIFAQTVSRANLGPVGTRAIQVGAAISEGMSRGVRAHRNSVNAAVVDVAVKALREGAGAIGARSPSRKAAEQIGKPFVEGIAMGISRNRLLALQAASSLTLDLFQGQVLNNLKKGQRVTFNSIYRDLKGQTQTLVLFNKDLLKLASEGVPTALLQQLAQTGAAGAPFIHQLATASKPELDRYVALWQKANAQIVQDTQKSATTVRKELPQAVQDARREIASAVQNLAQMYQSLLQQNQQDFGQLFTGPYMQSARVQNRIDWGAVLRPQDLQRDLQSQVNQFRKWHNDLNRLQKRGAPQSLIAALRQLGPESEKQIRLLLQMSPRQWREYLNTWRTAQRLIHAQTMRDLNNQLKQYRRFGRNIALAIIAGIRDENVGMERALRRLLYRMFPELFARARQSATGATTAPHRPPRHPHHPPHHHAQTRHPQAVHEHTHLHVHGDMAGKDVNTQLRHLHFRHRNRRR